ncbi:MAG: PCYCGC motif-containing (lipo)protein, partial [Rhodospirillales bacterium]
IWGLPGTGRSDEFPAFVFHSPEAERGYGLALEHQQLFAHMACYCGCGVFLDDPHRGLLDCFMNDDGSLDAHASSCSLCLDIAFDGVAWRAQGRSSAEVQALVDEKYEGFGPRTRQEAVAPAG